MSYLHMICTIVMGVFALYSVFTAGIRMNSTEDIIGVSALILCPSILLANSSVNIYLLERFYPDRLFGKKINRFSILLFILSLLVVTAVLLVTIAGFSETLSRQDYTSGQSLMISLILATFSVIGLTGLYIVVVQVSLRKAIRRNHEASLNRFLDSEPAQGFNFSFTK